MYSSRDGTSERYGGLRAGTRLGAFFLIAAAGAQLLLGVAMEPVAFSEVPRAVEPDVHAPAPVVSPAGPAPPLESPSAASDALDSSPDGLENSATLPIQPGFQTLEPDSMTRLRGLQRTEITTWEAREVGGMRARSTWSPTSAEVAGTPLVDREPDILGGLLLLLGTGLGLWMTIQAILYVGGWLWRGKAEHAVVGTPASDHAIGDLGSVAVSVDLTAVPASGDLPPVTVAAATAPGAAEPARTAHVLFAIGGLLFLMSTLPACVFFWYTGAEPKRVVQVGLLFASSGAALRYMWTRRGRFEDVYDVVQFLGGCVGIPNSFAEVLLPG